MEDDMARPALLLAHPMDHVSSRHAIRSEHWCVLAVLPRPAGPSRLDERLRTTPVLLPAAPWTIPATPPSNRQRAHSTPLRHGRSSAILSGVTSHHPDALPIPFRKS